MLFLAFKWFGIGMLSAIISVYIQIKMIQVPIVQIATRKKIIILHKFFYFSGFCCMIIGMMMLYLTMLYFISACIYGLSYMLMGNKILSAYFSITMFLVSCIPFLILVMKMLKKQHFNSRKKRAGSSKDSQIYDSLYYNTISEVICIVNKIPYEGIIHLLNLILLIYANCTKILEVDINVASSSIYMAIATYYATQKVIEYIKKRFAALWKRIDNKLFYTDEINSDGIYNLKNIMKINRYIHNNYVLNGKYELEDDIMIYLGNKDE